MPAIIGNNKNCHLKKNPKTACNVTPDCMQYLLHSITLIKTIVINFKTLF